MSHRLPSKPNTHTGRLVCSLLSRSCSFPTVWSLLSLTACETPPCLSNLHNKRIHHGAGSYETIATEAQSVHDCGCAKLYESLACLAPTTRLQEKLTRPLQTPTSFQGAAWARHS